MKKVLSLEELKARSEKFYEFFRLIEIAKETKSPTAAFDLAVKGGFTNEQAKGCRYMALIKRDYGIEEFNHFFPLEEKRKMLCYLTALLETSQRFSYLLNFGENKGFKFPKTDFYYIRVVKSMLEKIENMNVGERDDFLGEEKKTGVLSLFSEARMMVFYEKENSCEKIDHYTLEKTLYLLIKFIKHFGKKIGARDFIIVDAIFPIFGQS